MEEIKRLYKVIANMPRRYVYGNPGDFARYKYLVGLSPLLSGKDSFVNKHIRDKADLCLYPDMLGNAVFTFDGVELREVGRLEELATLTSGTIYMPGASREKTLTFFPVDEGDDADIQDDPQDNLYAGTHMQEAIFVESYPYGKRSFIDMVCKKNRELPFYVTKKVLFWDEGRKYGASDISDGEAAFSGIIQTLGQYVPKENFIGVQPGDGEGILELRGQLKAKKKGITRQRTLEFDQGFEGEYAFLKERFLCSEEKKGMISHTAYEAVSDHRKVKGTDHVEKKILDNFLINMEEHKEDLVVMLNYLYSMYLDEIDVVTKEYLKKMADSLEGSIRSAYRFGKKQSCPDSALKYRKLCGQEQYILKLKQHVDQILEKTWKKQIFDDIRSRLQKCEEKYDEAN